MQHQLVKILVVVGVVKHTELLADILAMAVQV
jgi:hypothetical protein